MNKLLRLLPLIVCLALGVVLYRGLFLDPQSMPSALVGKKVPSFSLARLSNAQLTVNEQDLLGNITLLNVWATWCPSCRYEHPYLLDIAKRDRVKIFGLNYKDKRIPAQKWLKQLGDPYIFSIFDELGTLGLDLGVYGAPETFVIDHHGIIRKRFAGVIDENVWQREFIPLIVQLEAEQSQAAMLSKNSQQGS
jgi:cytochrome c biogenesis protein CcmG/thiol:disulfide interchange protein DsbE